MCQVCDDVKNVAAVPNLKVIISDARRCLGFSAVPNLKVITLVFMFSEIFRSATENDGCAGSPEDVGSRQM